jgi:hypothetical protein
LGGYIWLILYPCPSLSTQHQFASPHNITTTTSPHNNHSNQLSNNTTSITPTTNTYSNINQTHPTPNNPHTTMADKWTPKGFFPRIFMYIALLVNILGVVALLILIVTEFIILVNNYQSYVARYGYHYRMSPFLLFFLFPLLFPLSSFLFPLFHFSLSTLPLSSLLFAPPKRCFFRRTSSFQEDTSSRRNTD